jgi:hypothetical protein
METSTVTAGPSGTTVQPDLTSAGGPTGVQNGSGPAPAPAAANGGQPADWTSGLPEQTRMFVQNKGFKDPTQVVESYQNLEKLMGAPKDRLLKLPEKFDSPEMNEIYDKLGRPKDPTGYTFKIPEGQKANTEFTGWAQSQFHKLGLTKAQGEQLAQAWNEYAVGDVQKQTEQYQSTLKSEDTALKKEWGAAYDQNIKACQKAAKEFGLNEENISKLEQALGYSATLKFMAKIGAKVGEDSFVTGDNGSGFQGALTPDRALAEIAELKKDAEFVRKYASGDREAYQKMERLHKFAFPELPE